MEKTQEQNDSRLEQITKNFIEQLKGEYKDFSVVISVNDGMETSCFIQGSTLNLINNVDCIEENKVYQKIKKIKELISLTEGD